MDIRWVSKTRWTWAWIRISICGYSHGRILSATVDMVASGYLQYPIRIWPVAISSCILCVWYPLGNKRSVCTACPTMLLADDIRQRQVDMACGARGRRCCSCTICVVYVRKRCMQLFVLRYACKHLFGRKRCGWREATLEGSEGQYGHEKKDKKIN